MGKQWVKVILSAVLAASLAIGSGCQLLPESTPAPTAPVPDEETTPPDSLPAGTEESATSREPESSDPVATPAPASSPTLSPSPPPPPEPPRDTGNGAATTGPGLNDSAYVKFEGVDGESKSVGHSGWSDAISRRAKLCAAGASPSLTPVLRCRLPVFPISARTQCGRQPDRRNRRKQAAGAPLAAKSHDYRRQSDICLCRPASRFRRV